MYIKALTLLNIASRFEKTSISAFYYKTITEQEFLSSFVTDKSDIKVATQIKRDLSATSTASATDSSTLPSFKQKA